MSFRATVCPVNVFTVFEQQQNSMESGFSFNKLPEVKLMEDSHKLFA